MQSPSSLAHKTVHRKAVLGIPFIDTPWTRMVDALAYPVGLIGLASALPQLFEVWVAKNAEGVSLLTWGAWCFTSLFWIAYARAHKAKVLVFLNSCWLVIHLLVVAGTLLYR